MKISGKATIAQSEANMATTSHLKWVILLSQRLNLQNHGATQSTITSV